MYKKLAGPSAVERESPALLCKAPVCWIRLQGDLARKSNDENSVVMKLWLEYEDSAQNRKFPFIPHLSALTDQNYAQREPDKSEAKVGDCVVVCGVQCVCGYVASSSFDTNS
jgi:hypothetical protein